MTLFRNTLFSTLVREKSKLTSLIVLLVLQLTLISWQTNRYTPQESPWRFETFDSCTSMVSFYLFALIIINNTGITWAGKRDGVSVDALYSTVRHAVFQKFVGGVIYITVLSVVLFPILYHFGFNFLYLLCGYLYVIGFGSLCLLPINIMCEMSHQTNWNLRSPRHILPLLLLLPAFGGYVLISEFINDTTWQTAVVLIILAVLSLLVYKPMAIFLLKRYDI